MTVSLEEKAINNNDVLRRVRYIFDFNDQTMVDIFALGGCKASQVEVTAWLARDDDKSFKYCENEPFIRFLNGLIIKYRGPKGDKTPEPESVLNNNVVLRKLKIALDLQADDLLQILSLSDFMMSKHELSALFRRPDHKNYRECLDQVLRNVLDGMAKHYKQS